MSTLEIEPEAAFLDIDVKRVFEPLLQKSRYKGAYGGRGSGKSQFFADLIILRCMEQAGCRVLCCREIQKSLKESAKRLIESKIEKYELGSYFEVQTGEIKTPGGGSIVFAGLQDHTSESIKSYEGFDIAWVEEAQTVSARSLNLLRPTIRKPGSELWFSWNPRFDTDAVDVMLRGEEKPSDAIVVKSNWSDLGKLFPAELEQERQDCLRAQPEQYDHIWEGGYATVSDGAYYAQALAQARTDNRIGTVSADPLLAKKAYWDIGVSDATAIWVCQQKGDSLRFIDHYEAVGQDLAAHLNWLRQHHDSVECILPHDGAKRDAVTAIRFEDHIRSAGFSVRTVENQGKGAAMKRVEAARRMFGRFWFDEERCAKGLKAIGWYHEKINDGGYGVGPEHDWSSHSADAFGLAAVDYAEPRVSRPIRAGMRKGIV